MKKLTLFSIIISLFVFAGMSQQTGRLDSTLTYRTFSPDYSWDQIYRTIYHPDVPAGISLLQHDKKDLKTAIPDWTRLCDDSIVSKPNLMVHYTIPVIFGRTEYIPYEKEQNILYPNGSIQRHETFRGADDGVSWTPNEKVDFTYHADGSVATKSSYFWHLTDELMVLGERRSYSYNKKGLLLEEVIENGSNISRGFGLNERLRFKYNSAGQLIKKEQHFYDHRSQSWYNTYETDYYYRNDGKLSIETVTVLRANGPAEILDSTRYNYDSQSRILRSVRKMLLTTGWEVVSDLNYDYSNNEVKLTEVKYASVDEDREEVSREEKTWNEHGDLVLHTLHKALNPTDTYREEYFYSYKNTSLSQHLTESCKLPNPIASNVSLNCSMLTDGENYNISLFDFQGKLVSRAVITKGEQLHFLAGIKQGMYVIQASSRTGVLFRQKVLIQE